MVWKKVLIDFFLAGSLIALIVAVAQYLSAVMAGILAALPIRLVISLLFIKITGNTSFIDVSRGMLVSMTGYVAFVLSFYYFIRRIDFWYSLFIALILCTVFTIIFYLIFK